MCDNICIDVHRFISGLGSTRPSVLVARRQPNSEKQCIISERHLCVSERETATSGQENSDSSHEEESTTIHAQTEVASRQQFDAPVSEEREEREGPDDAGREDDEAVESENAVSVAPSRALKHKAVEQRRKKKISEAIQQLLDILRPPSPAGKMVCGKSHSPWHYLFTYNTHDNNNYYYHIM